MSDDKKQLYHLRGVPIPDTPLPGEDPKPWGTTEVIGKRLPRVDAYERVSGTAVYPSDVSLPNMLYGAILRCHHPHAVVKAVETGAAEKIPGVHAVLHRGSPLADVWWSYPKDVKTKLFDPRCRFEGEPVAAAAAESPSRAWDALRAVKVDYDVLPFVVDEVGPLAPGAPQVHEGGNKAASDRYSRGDVDRGFAEADVVLEETYHCACEIHTPLEPHGCVASWDGDRLTVWESTQGVYAIQSTVAKTLGLPLSRVRVIGHYMGGGFGSKLQADKSTIIAALLAKATGRPVKLFAPREDTFLAMGNRPPSTLTLRAGVKRDGTLTALDLLGTATGGAYPAGGIGGLDWQIKDLYLCPNVRTELTDVYTHTGPARPFRAPGHPQASWALEQMLDALARAIGMDPVELRLKNVPLYSQARAGNPPYTSTGLNECLNAGAEAFGWGEARKRAEASRRNGHVRRGVGVASALWVVGGGGPPSTVILKLFSDGSANLNMGASDIGTGTKTVMAMVVAEELGVDPESIQIENADTETTQYATSSGGSKTIPTESPAVRAAAVQVKQQLFALAAEQLKVSPSSLELRGDVIASRDDPSHKVRIPDVAGLKSRGVLVGIGYRGPNPAGKTVCPFAAQFCEVEVNLKTGELRILRFLGAHDSGRVMNRLTYDNQVFGGITMGIGFGTTEIRMLDRKQTGKMVNRNWHDYKIPTAADVPSEMTSLPIELGDREMNSTGAKGLGEPVTIPTAAAIANAVYDAVGIRMTSTPINPLQLCHALAAHPERRS